MKTISKRELNQQTAQVLEGVALGTSVLVTERGVPRWRIDAFVAEADPVARLRAEGRITPAKSKPAPWPNVERRYSPADIDRMFADSRGDH